jgi:hypothetical protein
MFGSFYLQSFKTDKALTSLAINALTIYISWPDSSVYHILVTRKRLW